MLIRGARIFDGEDFVDDHDVLVAGGAVTALEPAGKLTAPVDSQELDASGKLLAPGFIDLHCHLRDPGYTWKEDIFSGSAAAVAGGFTTVACMPNTNPPIDRGPVAEYIRDRAERCGLCRVLPAGALSKGRAGSELADLAALYAAGVRVFSDDGSDTAGTSVMLRALEFLSMLPGTRVLVHCEVPELAAGVMHEGVTSAKLGHGGIHRLSEDIGAARAVLLALSARQPLQVTHIASSRTLDIVRFAKELALRDGNAGLISADVTFNHLLLTDAAIEEHGPLAKINPPLRSEDDRQALLAAVADGTIDALITDHAPHTVDEKDQEMDHAPFGLVGFELAFPLLYRHIAGLDTAGGKISLKRILKLLTSRPASLLHPLETATKSPGQLTSGSLTDFHPVCIPASPGHIRPGGMADMVLIDLEPEWTVDPEQLHGKGRNTPFGGWEAQGRVELTIKGGRVVYSADGE
jgi:dihydroorotase